MRPSDCDRASKPSRIVLSRFVRKSVFFAGGMLALAGLLTPAAIAQTQTAQYEITFDATWSAVTHPVQYPAAAHFSRLVGATHDGGVSFWAPGTLASTGIERMAELGTTGTLVSEIQAEVTAGFADQSFVGAESLFFSPGTSTLQITVDQDFPLLTLVSMVAPSPDWFAGVHDLPLFDRGWWVPEVSIDLLTYDAGTDDGVTFQSQDADSNPAQLIELQGAPLEVGVPVATMTITRLPEPGIALGLLAGTSLLSYLARERMHNRFRSPKVP